MRRAKRITALAVAAAMVLSNVAYAAPDTGSVATQTGAESAESLNSQSGTSGGAEEQASEPTGNGTSDSSSQQSDQQAVKQNDGTQTTTPDVGEQTDSQSATEETKETETSTTEEPAAASESQKEQSQDTEETKETKTEEEKVLYDIKFETPEKHGKVTDMDGNEVADGKTLKTDESGKIQFKVKADDGYQVSAVYQMPDEKTPLKLVKDSYYELQVTENTTVKVVYQKIPEKNDDSEDAEQVEQKDEAGDQTDKSDQQTTEKSDEADQQTQDEETKPAQTISTTASDGAVITVKATEGALPSGATVTATPVDSNLVKSAVENAVNEEGKQLLNYKAYDITILDSAGKEIQPDKNITVSISSKGIAGDNKSVYHIADGSKKAEKIADVKKGNVSTFSAKHFSIYVVAGSEEIDPDEDLLTVTISFMYESGAIAANPYVLTAEKENDKYSVNYDVPSKTGYTAILTSGSEDGFRIENGTLMGTFSEKGSYQVEILYVANTVEYTVKHLYEDQNGEYVEDEDAEESLEGKVGELTNAVEKTKKGFTSLGVEQKVIEENGTVVEIKYERNTYTLTYLTLGGSYVPSVSAKYGSEVKLTDVYPTRKGYTFKGWYTDEKCTQKASDPFTLKEDTKLYAKWDGDVVNYSIVYLTENADDDGYSYAGTVMQSAKAGTDVVADASTQKPSGFDNKHFTFEESSMAKVESDGSTVITVKYSRNEYTITFDGTDGKQLTCKKEEHTHNWRCYDRRGNLICNKEEHTHTNTCYEYFDEKITITAKYQADISEKWNAAVGRNTPFEGISWSWNDDKSTGFQATMPGENKTVSKSENSGTIRRELFYYVEDPNGTVVYDDIKFREYTTVVLMLKDEGVYPTFDEEFFVIDGYDRFASTIEDWYDGNNHTGNVGWNHADWDKDGGGKFYYTRSEYNLQLVNGDQTETKKVEYLSDISKYLGEPAYNPLGDGTFDGWYLDPQFQSKYNGDKKMPKNLVLYAKWNPITYEVKFVDSTDESTIYETQKVESKGLVDVVIPEKSGYVFKGWYTSQDCAEESEFDYARQITENTTLYAKWEANSYTTYTVKYVTDSGEQVAEPETHSGKVGNTALAKAKKAEGDFAKYTVDAAVKTIVLQPDSAQNVITFVYKNVGELKYTVQYVDEEGKGLYEEPEVTSSANYIKISVSEGALNEIHAKGYELSQNYQWVSLTTGRNIVTFKCNKAEYSITYKNVEGAQNDNPNKYNAADLKGNPITLNDPKIDGKVFVGWEFTSVDGDVVSKDHDPSRTVIEYGSYGDLEFTACWAELEVTDVNEVYADKAYKTSAKVKGTEGYTVYYSTNNGETWVTEEPSLTDVGSLEFDVKAEKNGYRTLLGKGTINVSARHISVAGNTKEENYDGQEKSVSGLQIPDNLVNGHEISCQKAEAKGIDAGTYKMGLTKDSSFVIKKGNQDVTQNYVIDDVTDGWLKINPNAEEVTVTITGNTKTETYDGTEKSVTGYTYKAAKGKESIANSQFDVTLAEGQKAEAKGINADTYKMDLTEKSFVVKSTNYSHIKVVVEDGWLKIKNSETPLIFAKGDPQGYEEKYDGAEHGVLEGLTVTGIGDETFVYGTDEMTVEYHVGDNWVTEMPKIKDAGSVMYEIRVTVDNYEPLEGNVTAIVNKRKVTLTSATDEKAYDGTKLENHDVTVGGDDGFVEGEGVESYSGWKSITNKGKIENSFDYDLKENTKAGNYEITKKPGTLTITINTTDLAIDAETAGYTSIYDGQSHDAVTNLKVTGVNGTEIAAEDMTVEYRLSDEDEWSTDMPQVKDVADSTPVQIQVTVPNYAPVTKTVEAKVSPKSAFIITDSATKTYDGQVLTAEGRVNGIVDGETYEFTVTGSQTLVGTSKNTYTMVWAEEGNTYTADKNNYIVSIDEGTLEVTDGSETDPINPEDVVKKTHGTPEDGGTYKAGDVVTFTVTAANIYDEVKTITLHEIEGVTLEQSVFENVQPGATVTTTASYTITEEDILKGEFKNTVTASFGDGEPEYKDDDTVEEIEDPAGHLTINKVTTSTPANGISYVLGEEITYQITAVNDGNLTLTDVVVTDDLTGDEWTIESLAPGESKNFTAVYKVTEKDILEGEVVNTATAEGTSPDPEEPEVPVTPGEKEDPTDTPKANLFVEKTAQPDADGVYNLGDEIAYTIKVVNNGNVTVTDIDVADDLTGATWEIESLAPGEAKEFTTSYTVNEDDILNGSITNVATVEGTDPDGEPVENEGTETVSTDTTDSHMTVTKTTTSTPGEDGTYGLGDTITYQIVATNDGNLTLTNVVVTDDLTGDEWIVESLAPGESKTFETDYVVTEDDIHNGSVINEATATAESKDDEDPEIIPGETEDQTDSENPELSISKNVVDAQTEYQIGDTIQYQIKVTNEGNVTQDDILVTDMLHAAGDIVITDVTGAEGEIDGANVTLDSLAPGKTATIDCEYTVLKEDRGNTITNVAVADDADGEDPQTPEVPAEVEDVYDINVVHRFADDEESDVELPDDYTIENVAVGTERTFTAESVEGYTAYPAAQTVKVEDKDITVTFIYYTDAMGTDPENPDTPDKIPDKYQAVVTFEAVNGTVDRSMAVVTLMKDGKPAEDGTGYLTEDQIATATANAGYDQASLAWSSEVPTTEVPITEDRTFTATFTATQTPVDPDEPDEPEGPTTPTLPVTPTTPGTPTTPTLPVTPATPGTTTTPRLAVVQNYADGVVVDDAQPTEDDYNLNEVERDGGTETIDEDATPLGNMDLDKDDDHKCCILHFILLVLALIVELIYTHDRKKRQERIFELRRELADIEE